MSNIVRTICTLFFVPQLAWAVPSQANTAATHGLKVFEDIAAHSQSVRSGLAVRNADDFKSARLEQPLPVYFIELSQLLSYSPGTNAAKLLRDAHSLIYPISIGGVVKSSVKIREEADGTWRIIEIQGDTGQITKVMNAVKKITLGEPPGDIRYIEIPGTDVLLIGHIRDNHFSMASVYDDVTAGLKAAEPMPAQKLLLGLATKVSARVRRSTETH